MTRDIANITEKNVESRLHWYEDLIKSTVDQVVYSSIPAPKHEKEDLKQSSISIKKDQNHHVMI